MTRFLVLFTLVCLLFCNLSAAQTIPSLRTAIASVLAEKNAVVGVAIRGMNDADSISFNGDGQFPLQSVFKFHIALVIVSEIDKGKLSLDQKVKISKKELLPGLYSPLRDKYPNGATLSIAELITYSVSKSDNVTCDVLLRLLGGPAVVEAFFHRHGFKDLAIKINEEVQQAQWDLQFQNWTTPMEANAVLKAFYDNHGALLSAKSHGFIWRVMRGTETGKDRLKAALPPGTVVAHKTGTSATNKAGVTAATNDIGIVFLPNGQHYFISVFVSNSTETAAVNEKIIADISKAAWDYFHAAPGNAAASE